MTPKENKYLHLSRIADERVYIHHLLRIRSGMGSFSFSCQLVHKFVKSINPLTYYADNYRKLIGM